jgi:hypothetical protein
MLAPAPRIRTIFDVVAMSLERSVARSGDENNDNFCEDDCFYKQPKFIYL